MAQLIGGLTCILIIVAAFFLVYRGWRSRQQRQADIAAPVAWDGMAYEGRRFPGSYVATVRAGEPLERVAVHELGVRTGADVVLAPAGIAFERDGCADFLIPRADVESVRTESGMVGKFVERDGLIVIRWRLGAALVDTGFRTQYAADKQLILDQTSTDLEHS